VCRNLGAAGVGGEKTQIARGFEMKETRTERARRLGGERLGQE